jgi:G:T/U-mismatch repair DNA glycosylase
MKSIHPFEPFVPTSVKKLIIGTTPPERFCGNEPLKNDEVNFYYGSNDNGFWKILNEIFNKNLSFANTLEAIEERKLLLTDLGIGITDIVAECIHEGGKSSDNDLKEIKHKDLSTLLKTNESIDTLIYTSEFVKKQINQYLGSKAYHIIDAVDKKKQKITINGKIYNVVILYSPSRNALRNMGENGKNKRKEQYVEVFKKA